MSFKIPVANLLEMKVDEVKAHLQKSCRPLNKIKFLDLLLENPKAELINGMNRGVYLFFTPNGECTYLGKTHTRNFVERLGAHFSMQPKHKGNEYLRLTLEKSRGKNGLQGEAEHKDYAAMVNTLGDHRIALINVYHWEGIKKVLNRLGGDGEEFEGVKRRDEEVWGAEIFIDALETTLQAIYCPPEDKTGNSAFLIKPKHGRDKLRKRQTKLLARKNEKLAKLIRR